MEEANTMGPNDGNESRHLLPAGVGNNKWVDRKNKANSNCSVNVFWDPSESLINVAFITSCEIV